MATIEDIKKLLEKKQWTDANDCPSGGYYDFPHTRNYDSDLGFLIRKYKELGNDYNILVKIYEYIAEEIEDLTLNQLKEWLDDGTIENIVISLGQVVKYFDTTEEMLKDTSLQDGQIVKTIGYSDINDGMGGLFKVTNNAIENLFSLQSNGKFFNFVDKDINIEMIYTKTFLNTQVNANTISLAINELIQKNYNIYITDSIVVSSTIYINKPINFIVCDNGLIKNVQNGLDHLIEIEINANFVKKENYKSNEINLCLECNNMASTGVIIKELPYSKCNIYVQNPITVGVQLSNCVEAQIETIKVNTTLLNDEEELTRHYERGVEIYLSSDNYIENIITHNAKTGLRLSGNDNSIGTLHCYTSTQDNVITGVETSYSLNVINHLIMDCIAVGIRFVLNSSSDTPTLTVNCVSIVVGGKWWFEKAQTECLFYLHNNYSNDYITKNFSLTINAINRNDNRQLYTLPYFFDSINKVSHKVANEMILCSRVKMPSFKLAPEQTFSCLPIGEWGVEYKQIKDYISYAVGNFTPREGFIMNYVNMTPYNEDYFTSNIYCQDNSGNPYRLTCVTQIGIPATTNFCYIENLSKIASLDSN